LILAYNDLVKEWKRRRVRFEPDISLGQIGLSSIDLRLGWVFTRLKTKSGVIIQPARGFDPTDLVEHQDFTQVAVLGKPPTFRLPPGEFRLALTLEEVSVPNNLAANVQGKSSIARSGLAVHITAPHIHPGFTGRITLELYNHGPWELELFPGEDRICQVIYYRVQTPVPESVAKALSSYMRQPTPFPTRKPEASVAEVKPRRRSASPRRRR
jgi:dCTP deaminase